MANRQQRRAAQQKAGSNPLINPQVSEAVKGFLANVQKNKPETEPEENDEEELENFNILPFPVQQEIVEGKWMQWLWRPGGDIKVWGILFLNTDAERGYSKGEYTVQLSMPKHEETFMLSPVVSKVVGQAMISAWNWETIWKLHAGEFLSRSFGLNAPEPYAKASEEVVDGEILPNSEAFDPPAEDFKDNVTDPNA